MTPLAARLSKHLIAPSKRLAPFWRDNIGVLKRGLYEIHCFEVTQILPLVKEIRETIRDRFGEFASIQEVTPEASDFIGGFAFLPAPKTWIEFYSPITCTKVAFLLHEISDAGTMVCGHKWAEVTMFGDEFSCALGYVSLDSDDFMISGGDKRLPSELFMHFGHDPNRVISGLMGLIHMLLIVINSPKIIGRRQFMPNVGLERRLTRGLGVGKFPLHAWTEITLNVAKPLEIDDGEPHEAHLTGRRALHFCRKHIRILNGRLSYVRAHWRGDPALGIKQSRYKVVA